MPNILFLAFPYAKGLQYIYIFFNILHVTLLLDALFMLAVAVLVRQRSPTQLSFGDKLSLEQLAVSSYRESVCACADCLVNLQNVPPRSLLSVTSSRAHLLLLPVISSTIRPYCFLPLRRHSTLQPFTPFTLVQLPPGCKSEVHLFSFHRVCYALFVNGPCPFWRSTSRAYSLTFSV